MSKPTVRVIVSVLIGLAIVLAVYASVQAASPGAVRGQVHLTAGLMPDLSHHRSPAVSLNAYYSDLERPAQFHDCGSDDSSDD